MGKLAYQQIYFFIIVTIVLTIGVATESEEITYEETRKPCSYFYDQRYAAPSPGLVNCSWYSNQACCTRTEVTSVFSNMYPLHQASKICRFQMNYLMCYFCSPDQEQFYKDKLMVCSEYCDALYDNCKLAFYDGDTVGSQYQNGTALCEAQNFQVVEGSDCFEFDPTVFDIAAVTSSSLFAIVGLSILYLIQF